MYAQFMLFATLAVGAQVQAVRRGRRIGLAALRPDHRGDAVDAVLRLPAVDRPADAASLVAWWHRRHDRAARRRLVLGWLAATAIIVVVCLPMLEFLPPTVRGYATAATASSPGRPAPATRRSAATISIYAVGANLIWAVWGYHSDGGDGADRRAVAAADARRPDRARARPQRSEPAPAGARGRADDALFLIGSMKRDLFELRYFSGAVPAALLLVARLVTATTRRRVAVLVAGTLMVATHGARAARPADQRRQPPALRLPGRARLGAGTTPGRATCCSTSRATWPT